MSKYIVGYSASLLLALGIFMPSDNLSTSLAKLWLAGLGTALIYVFIAIMVLEERGSSTQHDAQRHRAGMRGAGYVDASRRRMSSRMMRGME
jgi:hypothetical protein